MYSWLKRFHTLKKIVKCIVKLLLSKQITKIKYTYRARKTKPISTCGKTILKYSSFFFCAESDQTDTGFSPSPIEPKQANKTSSEAQTSVNNERVYSVRFIFIQSAYDCWRSSQPEEVTNRWNALPLSRMYINACLCAHTPILEVDADRGREMV